MTLNRKLMFAGALAGISLVCAFVDHPQAGEARSISRSTYDEIKLGSTSAAVEKLIGRPPDSNKVRGLLDDSIEAGMIPEGTFAEPHGEAKMRLVHPKKGKVGQVWRWSDADHEIWVYFDSRGTTIKKLFGFREGPKQR